MSRPPPHKFYDDRNLALHQLIATRLREEPELLHVGQQTLDRWKLVAPNENADREWATLLASDGDAVIAAITEDSHEGRRLRQSSPLLSILSITERSAIRAHFEVEYFAKLSAGESVAIPGEVVRLNLNR